jgi:hypothetical protein
LGGEVIRISEAKGSPKRQKNLEHKKYLIYVMLMKVNKNITVEPLFKNYK